MPAPWHLATDTYRIRKICVGPYENNAYVLACSASGDGVVIDAAAEPERIVAACADVRVRAILTTHGHHDHVAGARPAAAALAVPLHLHPSDADIAGFTPDAPLDAGVFPVGALELAVVPTPGHTPGSTCFLLPGVVFSGDTLFPGGPGATRFPYSSFDEILRSITTSLFTLDDDTLVLPGHGLDTTIGTERPQLAAWRARGW